MRTFIYSLRRVNDKLVLSIDLMGCIVFESFEILQLNFNGKIVELRKSFWVNSMKVCERGGHDFLVCTKRVSRESAMKKLLTHMELKSAINRMVA